MRTGFQALAAIILLGATSAEAQTNPAKFLALSDIHYTAQANENCYQPGPETSPTLLAAAQSEVQALIAAEPPAFAIYLGDLPSHCPGHPQAEFATALDSLFAMMRPSGTKLIYVPGNNDSLGGDYAAFTTNGKTPLDISTGWAGQPVLNPQVGDYIDSANLPKGYYSVYGVQATGSNPALRVIVLNTNMFTANYFSNQRASVQADTNAQIEWLNRQLNDAASKAEKVIIAMHVPPGIDGFGNRAGGIATMWSRTLQYSGTDPALTPGWVQKTFLQIVAAHQSQIVGLLSSHTHFNDIRRLRDCSQPWPTLGAFTELDVGVASITTDHNNFPSAKVFTHDNQFEWIDTKTYYATDSQGSAWATTYTDKPLTFAANYPCAACTGKETLKERIAKIDSAIKVNTSDQLAGYMMAWLKVGAPPPSNPRYYKMALDVTCDAPPNKAMRRGRR